MYHAERLQADGYVLDAAAGLVRLVAVEPQLTFEHARAFVVLLATGLNDAQGTPIYAGDIVHDSSARRYVVDWHDHGWTLRELAARYVGHRHFKDAQYMTVIGNSYEHPPLVLATG